MTIQGLYNTPMDEQIVGMEGYEECSAGKKLDIHRKYLCWKWKEITDEELLDYAKKTINGNTTGK